MNGSHLAAALTGRLGLPVAIDNDDVETPIVDYRDAAPHLNSPKYAALALELHRRGVMVHPSNIELWFVSTVHTEADIDTTLDAFEGAVKTTLRQLR